MWGGQNISISDDSDLQLGHLGCQMGICISIKLHSVHSPELNGTEIKVKFTFQICSSLDRLEVVKISFASDKILFEMKDNEIQLIFSLSTSSSSLSDQHSNEIRLETCNLGRGDRPPIDWISSLNKRIKTLKVSNKIIFWEIEKYQLKRKLISIDQHVWGVWQAWPSVWLCLTSDNLIGYPPSAPTLAVPLATTDWTNAG